ncbi:hypothetical protein FB45DRAFT_87187 [Roridomyces roridus]|uniref:Uncharacterized protein n=1 Tax=Roridomyces roridus TaxID=1738132 RepID=A0AAD7BME9_9AGAR|nr:hypothetical protein FB45DRAFT_87187 [Roridomyces roridus]
MYRIPKVSRRLVRNISDSGPDDWISPLIVVSRGLVSVGSCAPFPYVGTALSAGLALLELIQTVGRTADELKYLAESVVAIMKLLHDEMECHNHSRRTDGYRFERVCVEFHAHLNQLLNDIQAMSADWSSSRLRKYLKVNCVREEVAQFTRRVTDLRANATLMAATGTRMDLADVASAIEDVRTNVSHIQREMKIMRSTTPQPVTTLQQEFVRYEEDYHALKLGDIELDFDTARTSDFDLPGDNEGTKLGWTDYKGRVKGSPRTIRVYRGSDPLQSWKSFLSVLAECSPSPNLPQLFGFCSSPKLPALVFHGEFQTLDEYGTSLQSPHAIVKWEQKLVEQVMELHRYRLFQSEWVVLYARRFALVNAQNGKLVMMHVEEGMNSDFPCLTPGVGVRCFFSAIRSGMLIDHPPRRTSHSSSGS